MAVLEAFSHGLPVFMTRACNIGEGFDAEAAVEITTDPDAISQVLACQLARDDLAEFGARGQRLAAQSFAWTAVVRNLARAYAWACKAAPRPEFVFAAEAQSRS